jgi:hypothetical protein
MLLNNLQLAAFGGSAFYSSGNPQLALWAKFRRCFAASNWLGIAIDAGGMGNDPVTECDRIRAECSIPSIRFYGAWVAASGEYFEQQKGGGLWKRRNRGGRLGFM